MTQPINGQISFYTFQKEQNSFIPNKVTDTTRKLFPQLGEQLKTQEEREGEMRVNRQGRCASFTQKMLAAKDLIANIGQGAPKPIVLIDNDDAMVIQQDDLYTLVVKEGKEVNDPNALLGEAQHVAKQLNFLKKNAYTLVTPTSRLAQEQIDTYLDAINQAYDSNFSLDNVPEELYPHFSGIQTLYLDSCETIPEAVSNMAFLKTVIISEAQNEKNPNLKSNLPEKVTVHVKSNPLKIFYDNFVVNSVKVSIKFHKEHVNHLHQQFNLWRQPAETVEAMDFTSMKRDDIEELISALQLDLGACRGAYWKACGSHKIANADWVDANFTAHPNQWKTVILEQLKK